MNRIMSRGVWGAVFVTGLTVLGAGTANAVDFHHDDGQGSGLLSSLYLPVYIGGNEISIIGDAHSEGATSPSSADPVQVSGNAISVLGDAHSEGPGSTSPNGGIDVSDNAISVLGDSHSGGSDGSSGTTDGSEWMPADVCILDWVIGSSPQKGDDSTTGSSAVIDLRSELALENQRADDAAVLLELGVRQFGDTTGDAALLGNAALLGDTDLLGNAELLGGPELLGDAALIGDAELVGDVDLSGDLGLLGVAEQGDAVGPGGDAAANGDVQVNGDVELTTGSMAVAELDSANRLASTGAILAPLSLAALLLLGGGTVMAAIAIRRGATL